MVKKMDNRELEAFRYDLNEALLTSKPWAQFGHWYDIGGRLPHLSVEQCFLSLSLAFTFDDTAKRLKKVGFDAQEVKEALSAVRLQYYPHHFDPSKLTFFERIGLEGYLSILNSLKPTGLTIAESTLLSTAFFQGIRQYLLAAHEHANKATDVVDEAAEDTSTRWYNRGDGSLHATYGPNHRRMDATLWLTEGSPEVRLVVSQNGRIAYRQQCADLLTAMQKSDEFAEQYLSEIHGHVRP